MNTIAAIQGDPVPLARPGERLSIDPRGGVVRDVRLPGKAARLLEGAKVYIQRKRPGEFARCYEDVFGRVRNVRERGGQLFGDFEFNTGHPQAPMLVYDLEREPHEIGLSQTGLAPVSLDVVPITRVTKINDPSTWYTPLREQTVPEIAAAMLADDAGPGTSAPAHNTDSSARTTDPAAFDRAMHRLRAAKLRGEPMVSDRPTVLRIAAEMLR